MVDECIFCKISLGEISSEKIYENDNFFSIYDLAPQTEGHALIISKKHFVSVLDLPNSLGEELMDCIKKTYMRLVEKYGVDGFNVIANTFCSAGQIVDHVHFHIFPRKTGDEYSLSLQRE